jgi:hypothetical protein
VDGMHRFVGITWPKKPRHARGGFDYCTCATLTEIHAGKCNLPILGPRQSKRPKVLLVPDIRIERMTYRLQGGCSTPELIRLTER